jgi:hypothetical protein
MLKKPWTIKGDIRYFEVFKIAVFAMILIMVFSLWLSKTPSYSNANLWLVSLFYGLVFIQLSTLNVSLYPRLMKLLKISLIKLLHDKKWTINGFTFCHELLKEIKVYIYEKRFRVNAVIRC